MPRNLIIGGFGQDGRLLSEYLISQGEQVTAVIRGSNPPNSLPGVEYISVDTPNIDNYYGIISSFKPRVIYNLASLSSVAESEKFPTISFALNFELVKTIIQAVTLYLTTNKPHRIKLVQAGSSEMFGSSEKPIDEDSQMRPRSTYGMHKELAFEYLESTKGLEPNLNISNLILFNHESSLRPENFVSQKIAKAAASWYLQGDYEIRFGNIDVERDWGCAREYVRAMQLVGIQEANENYVIASGGLVKVSQILEHALHYVGFEGDDYSPYLDQALFRENETAPLIGNASKIQKEMGWKANRSIYSVIEEMVDHQISRLKEY